MTLSMLRKAATSTLTLVLVQCTLLSGEGREAELTLTLVAHDAAGHFRLLTLGLDTQASYEFERELSEMLLPPIPPSPVFDVRFMDLPGRRRLAGTGAATDIRKLRTSAQSDTFIIRFQAAEDALPLRFSWIAKRTALWKSVVVEYSSNGEKKMIDATDFSPFSIFDPSVSSLKIILNCPNRETKNSPFVECEG